MGASGPREPALQSAEDIFHGVAQGARRRRQRRAGGVAAAAVVAIVLGAVAAAAFRTPTGGERTTVSVAAPPPSTMLVIPAPNGAIDLDELANRIAGAVRLVGAFSGGRGSEGG